MDPSSSGGGIPMYQAVWKLSALAVVVAIGVVVVVQAQRGMQSGDAADDQEAAANFADADEDGDLGASRDSVGLEPPAQKEPEVALADHDEAGAGSASSNGRGAANSRTTIGADKFARRSQVADDDPDDSSDSQDDGEIPSARSSAAAAAGDPFDDPDDSPPPAQASAAGTREAAAPPAAAREKMAIDIIDVEDDDSPDDAENRITPIAASKSPPPKSRGPVLTLDDDDDESDQSTAIPTDEGANKSKPRLLGASENAAVPAKPARTNDKTADPFADDDAPVVVDKSRAKTALESDENDDAIDDDIDPARLPRTSIESKPTARHTLKDDEDDSSDTESIPVIDEPVVRRGTTTKGLAVPKGSIESDDDGDALKLPANKNEQPARLGDAIELDDSDDLNIDVKGPGRAPQVDRQADSNSTPLPTFPEMKSDADLSRTEEAAGSPGAANDLPQPELTIEKIAPATAVLGQPMVYHILIRNVGEMPAHRVMVEDIVPRGVKIDGSIPQAQLKNDRLIWNLGSLPAGREKKISVRVVPQAEGTIGSVATVNFSAEASPRSGAASPKLEFNVDAPRQALVGVPVDFHFRVTNVGPVAATGVTIRDVLPAALRHPDGDDLEYEIGQLPAGKSREVKLVLTAAQAGPTVNRVVVTADGNVAEEAQVSLEVVGPTLVVVRDGPKRLFPNKTGTYSNTVTNPGLTQVSGISVVETVPAGMEFVEAAEGGIYNAAKRSITWTINKLGPGTSKTVKATLRSNARGAQISVVRAYDPSGSSGETVAATHVSGVCALTIEIGEIPALIETGETVKVPVRILNRGSDSATNVRITLAVPAGMQLLAGESPTSFREINSAAAGGASAERAPRGPIEVQSAPILKIEPRADAKIEMTLKAHTPGAARLVVQAQFVQ